MDDVLMTQFFDLSHKLEPGMTYFPGDPEPVILPAKGAVLPWRVSELHIGSHTGTHIDASAHYFEEGRTIDQYSLDRFVMSGITIALDDLKPEQPISDNLLGELEIKLPKGGAILLRTGWDKYWGQELYLHHPYLTTSSAERLVQSGAGLVGIDALNVDSTVQGTDHVHQILLGSDILIVENLRGLGQLLPGTPYRCSFLPLLLTGLDGSPIRAVAWMDGED
jgi:kynurenine formamidase